MKECRMQWLHHHTYKSVSCTPQQMRADEVRINQVMQHISNQWMKTPLDAPEYNHHQCSDAASTAGWHWEKVPPELQSTYFSLVSFLALHYSHSSKMALNCNIQVHLLTSWSDLSTLPSKKQEMVSPARPEYSSVWQYSCLVVDDAWQWELRENVLRNVMNLLRWINSLKLPCLQLSLAFISLLLQCIYNKVAPHNTTTNKTTLQLELSWSTASSSKFNLTIVFTKPVQPFPSY